MIKVLKIFGWIVVGYVILTGIMNWSELDEDLGISRIGLLFGGVVPGLILVGIGTAIEHLDVISFNLYKLYTRDQKDHLDRFKQDESLSQ